MKPAHKLVIVALGFSGIIVSCALTEQKHRENIQSYIENNLKEAISKQESKLGIKHFGLPKIIYQSLANLDFTIGVAGCYNPEIDNLCLNRVTTPNNGLADIVGRFLGDPSIQETLDHELGHFYTDKLSESLGMGSWPNQINAKPMEVIGLNLISEGIAEYFKKRMNNSMGVPESLNWPKEPEELRGRVYDRGFSLVRPILE